jgi:putative two-component system response regulator
MRILIADDNHFYRRALEVMLRDWGYDVLAVPDGLTAWDVLQSDQAPKLAILDWMMPGLDGPEVCRRLRAVTRHEPTYVIVLTAKDGKENAITALESGADDYVQKPFDGDELRARLRVGRRIVGLQTSETVVYSFARAVDAKSPYTRGHSDRVTQYALALAQRLGLSQVEVDVVRRGGLMHDIGKICIPDAILNKPGPLTPDEYEVVRRHPMQGVQMVEPLESVRDTIPIIRWHHERMDGRGYPDGLEGEGIPLLARLVAVADVYDALRSDRPYRAGMPHERCLAVLKADAAGGGLDMRLVQKFCELSFDAMPGQTRPLIPQPVRTDPPATVLSLPSAS